MKYDVSGLDKKRQPQTNNQLTNNQTQEEFRMNASINLTKWGALLLISLMVLIFAVGCEDQIAPPTQTLEVSQQAKVAAGAAWQVSQAFTTEDQIAAFVNGETEFEGVSENSIVTPEQANKKFREMKLHIAEALVNVERPLGVNGDSLVFFLVYTDPVTGITVRKALYYDSQTGKARYYEALLNFPPQLRLAYDSTEVRADLNFTLEDSTDDRLESVYNFTQFVPGFFVDKSQSQAIATDWDSNNEVTGVEATNEVWFGSQNELEKLTQTLDFNPPPDSTGAIHEVYDFRDGGQTIKNVNFNFNNNTGDFNEQWRNGVTVTGTFDMLEDDNHGAFTRTVVLPAPFDPVRIDHAAEVILNPADSTIDMVWNEKLLFRNGSIDTTAVIVHEFYDGGYKNTNFQISKANGEHGEFTVVEKEARDEIDGYWVDEMGYYATFTAFIYPDGSAELWLKVWENEQSFLNGDPPILEAYFYFNPDGSGYGNYTEKGVTYKIEFEAGGKVKVVDSEGLSAEFSPY